MSIFPLQRPTFPLKRKKIRMARNTVLLDDSTVAQITGSDIAKIGNFTDIETLLIGGNSSPWYDNGWCCALKKDGTIICQGYTGDMSAYSNAIKFVQNMDYFVALMPDGTCKVISYDEKTNATYGYKTKIESATNVVDIAAVGWLHLAILKSDGTVLTIQCSKSYIEFINTYYWKDVVKIYGHEANIFGITSNGNVLFSGKNDDKYSFVTSLKNIKELYFGNENLLIAIDENNKRYHNQIRSSHDVSNALNTNVFAYVLDDTYWNNAEYLHGFPGNRFCIYGYKNDGTILTSLKASHALGAKMLASRVKPLEYTSLITSKTPINLLDKSKVKGFTIEGIQPVNTNRKVAFKVDNKWNKLTTDGALSPLPTQAITSDSVLAEGNTVSELTALANVPSFVGKMVYPAIALYADSNATVMPTIGMTVNAEIDTTVDVYTKTAYSQEFVLHNERDVLVKSVTVDSNTKGNGKITLKARYATFDETAITEEGAEQTEIWSDYVDLLSVINVKCHKLQIKTDYQVSITDGSDSATLNDVIITYAKDVVAKADGTTDLVTLTEKFTNDLTYVHTYIKHKELIDADLKAYVRLQKTPKKADFKLIGYGTGARKTYKVTDSGINQDSLMVYVNGKAVYDFDFNTETSEITLVADVDVPINATYEFGWELFNYVEMQKVVSQINDSGAYTTEYSYTIPAHDGEYTVTAIKYELIRPEGKVTNDVIGVGTGKRQIIQLPHYARKETIQCNGKWSYDYDSKRLTVIVPEGDNIVISYDWIAESPVVYGVMAGWAD